MATVERRETKDGKVRWTMRVFMGRDPLGVEAKEGRRYRQRLQRIARELGEGEGTEAEPLFLVATGSEPVEVSRHGDIQEAREEAERLVEKGKARNAGVWVAAGFLEDPDGPLVTFRRTGGKRRYEVETFDTQTAAKKKARYLERMKDGGQRETLSKDPLATYLAEWLDAKDGEVRARTIHDYRGIVRRYVQKPPKGAPRIGTVRLNRLTPHAFEGLYRWLWKEKGLSPRTIQYLHSVLRQALGDAVRKGSLPRNPTDHVKRPTRPYDDGSEGETGNGKGSAPGRAMRAMSEAEAGAFLEAARDDRYWALWVLLLTGGLRPGEALGLLWDDVDLEAGRVHVQRSLTRRGVKGWKLVEPKTDQARRVIPLPGVTLQALRSWKAQQAAERLKLGAEYEDHGLVFTTEFGTPPDQPNLYSRNFIDAMERAGFGTWEVMEGGEWTPEAEANDPEGAFRRRFRPAFRMYDLRHTCATLLLKKGVAAKIVSERLGHANITLTLDTYSHVLPDMQEGAVEALEAAFGKGVGT